MWARSALALVFALAATTSCARSTHDEPALPPPPTRWVTDGERMLSETTRASLDARLASYERDTGHQVIVWVGAKSGELGPELFAVRAFEAWRVGREGLDDGAVIFVFARDRTVRIEVGYGLEGDLTDADASRVIQEEMLPRFRAGDADGAVTRGVEAVLAQLGGASSAPVREQPRVVTREPPSPYRIGFMIVMGILFLILFITNPRLALLLLFSMGGRGGGFGGGGGGFGGGGGRSGGGGATGSW